MFNTPISLPVNQSFKRLVTYDIRIYNYSTSCVINIYCKENILFTKELNHELNEIIDNKPASVTLAAWGQSLYARISHL